MPPAPRGDCARKLPREGGMPVVVKDACVGSSAGMEAMELLVVEGVGG